MIFSILDKFQRIVIRFKISPFQSFTSRVRIFQMKLVWKLDWIGRLIGLQVASIVL